MLLSDSFRLARGSGSLYFSETRFSSETVFGPSKCLFDEQRKVNSSARSN